MNDKEIAEYDAVRRFYIKQGPNSLSLYSDFMAPTGRQVTPSSSKKEK